MLGKAKTPWATIKEVPDEGPIIETYDDAEPIGPHNKSTNQGNHPSRQYEPDILPELSPNMEHHDPPNEGEFDNLLITYLRGKSTLEIFNEELEPGDQVIAYI